jgi:DNA processing protein
LIDSETKERLADTIALLSIPGIGRGRFGRLVKRFGSASAALTANLTDVEAVPGLSATTAQAIREHCDLEAARQTAARIAQLGWEVLFPDGPEYPLKLAQIDDAPPLLFRLGGPPAPHEQMIGIVGTRHSTEHGRRFTHRLAGDLAAAGLTVVSGMAEGIDAAAHKGALDRGGVTVAIWGTPLDVVYPPSNRELAKRIAEQGAIYSEYLPGVETSPSNFPERNRIISGLSEAVVVVEAGRKSGALITAQCALDQGRDLFAVPGRPGAEKSDGTNELIKSGARLLTDAEDIFAEMPRLRGEISARQINRTVELTDTERKLVEALASGPLQLDLLGRQCGLAVNAVMEYLLAMELKGIVQELPGKRFALTDK